MLYDRKTGEKKNLTEGFDGWVGTFVGPRIRRVIFFVAEIQGDRQIFESDRPLDPPKPGTTER